MTNGTSQGLFSIVAVVIFGVFVSLSYVLFQDKISIGLTTIFKDGLEQGTKNVITDDVKDSKIFSIKQIKSFYNGSYSGNIMSGVVENSILKPNLTTNKDIFMTTVGATVYGNTNIEYSGNHKQSLNKGLYNGGQLKKPIILNDIDKYTNLIHTELPKTFKDNIYINSISYSTDDDLETVKVNGKNAIFKEFDGEKLITFDNLILDLDDISTKSNKGSAMFEYKGVTPINRVNLVGDEITEFENTKFNTTTTTFTYKPIKLELTNKKGNSIEINLTLTTSYMSYTKK